MSFFGDLFAGKAAQEAANYNAKIIETNKKAKLAEANRMTITFQNLTRQLKKFKAQQKSHI